MLIFSALSLLPHPCSLVSSPTELLWFPGGAMSFLTARSPHILLYLLCLRLFHSSPWPMVQPACIHHLRISFLTLVPLPGGGSAFFSSHSTAYVPGHSIAMLSYKCLWTHLYLLTHRKLQRGQYEENVITCTAASAWLPVRSYYCTYLGNKLNPLRAIQFNKHF